MGCLAALLQQRLDATELHELANTGPVGMELEHSWLEAAWLSQDFLEACGSGGVRFSTESLVSGTFLAPRGL